MFGVFGIQTPFWPAYLQGKGLNSAAIGWLVAVPYLVKALSNPAAGHWADRRGDYRLPLRALSLLALATTLLFGLTDNFWLLMALSLVAGGASAALIPLSDTLALGATRAFSLDYGRLRLWGSIGFILAAFLVGQLLTVAAPSAVLWATAAGMGLCLFVTLRLLPGLPARPEHEDAAPLLPLLKDPSFLLFLGAASLIQTSHALYYGFATLHWQSAGLSNGLIGLLWDEGVVAEVMLFALGSHLLQRATPVQLILAAGIGGSIRWTVLAVTTDPWLLALVQCLHAATYAACHLGAMQFIHRRVPANLAGRAQGIYSALSMGLAPGLALMGSGALYQAWGGLAFLSMALACALSLPLAWKLSRDSADQRGQ